MKRVSPLGLIRSRFFAMPVTKSNPRAAVPGSARGRAAVGRQAPGYMKKVNLGFSSALLLRRLEMPFSDSMSWFSFSSIWLMRAV